MNRITISKDDFMKFALKCEVQIKDKILGEVEVYAHGLPVWAHGDVSEWKGKRYLTRVKAD